MGHRVTSLSKFHLITLDFEGKKIMITVSAVVASLERCLRK